MCLVPSKTIISFLPSKFMYMQLKVFRVMGTVQFSPGSSRLTSLEVAVHTEIDRLATAERKVKGL